MVDSLLFIVYRRKKAFTLMELLVVMGVLALLLGVSIPFFANFSRGAKLKTAAQDIFSVLNTARSLAITQRQDYSVVFNISASPQSYSIINSLGQVYGKSYTLPSGVSFYRPANPDQPTTFSSHTATFSSTGGLTAPSAAVWIADKKGDFRRINVSRSMGKVKIDQEP